MLLKLPFLQNLNYKKPVAGLLVFVFVFNLVFAFCLLPAKNAYAIPVEILTESPEWKAAMAKQFGWEAQDVTFKTYDKVVQAGQFVAATASAGVDIWDKAYEISGDLMRAAGTMALHMILQMITNEIIKWVSGGGEPKFVSDWQGFLRDAANQAGGVFLDTLTSGFLCSPYAFQIRLALMPVPYFTSARCTLEQMGANLQNFFASFVGGGGWGTWLQVIQPQNNFYGSYWMALTEKNRQELAATEAAKNQAMSSGGFLGAEKCLRGSFNDADRKLSGRCNTISECDAMKKQIQESGGTGVTFNCEDKRIMTPGSLVQYQVQNAVDTTRQKIVAMIGGLTGNTGILQPYLMAIGFALINRVITSGLSAVAEAIAGGDQSYGPTFSSPNTPLPPTAPLAQETIQQGDAVRTSEEVLSSSPALIQPLKLLKENLQTELAPQQQNNLAVLNAIRDAQTQTLQNLKSLLASNCALPSWVSSQVISDTGATQIIKLSAIDIGEATFKKTNNTTGIGTTSSVETQEVIPQAKQQIDDLQKDIISANLWIADIDAAIDANNQAIISAQAYQDLYASIGVALTDADKQKLANAVSQMKADYNVALPATQKAANSQSTNLTTLIADIQDQTRQIITQSQALETARGATDSPAAGTLNYQLASVKSKPAEIQTLYQICLQEQQLQLLQQQQQQQSQSSPFLF